MTTRSLDDAISFTPGTQLVHAFGDFHAFESVDATRKLGRRWNSLLKSLAVMSIASARQQSTVHLANAAIKHPNQVGIVQLAGDDVILELLMSGEVLKNVPLESADS